MRPESRLRNGQAAVRLLTGSLRRSEAPESLQERLKALLVSMDPPSDPTPRASGSRPGANTLSKKTPPKKTSPVNDVPDFQSVFAGNGASGSGVNEQSGFRKFLKTRPGTAAAAGVILVALAGLLVVPGAWDVTFRRASFGSFSLQMIFPEGAPDYWLTGAEAVIFREGDNTLAEVASPSLRKSGDGVSMVSRKISLSAGAYRLRWSLGDRVSWQSFRLPSFRENRRIGTSPPLLVETLGYPPSFPLEFSWSAVDAMSGEDISGMTVLEWENVDSSDSRLVSGGRYQFTYRADGYKPAYFAVAVSPWRRNLNIQAALWPKGSTLIIQNDTGRSISPRLNGSGRYLDMQGVPETSRIGRLKTTENITLRIPPGSYVLSPGMGNRSVLELFLNSDDEVTVVAVSGDDGRAILETVE
jgi:hypothetical protein